mgnify:CR=1 FL=1
MAFFDKLGEMTKIVSEKASDSLATNNLIAEINLTKGNIQALQRELGEFYWAKFAVGEKLDDEAMFICDKIVLAHDKIKLLENQIEQIKAEGEAKAKILQAEAESQAIAMIAEAIKNTKTDPASYLLATKYIQTLEQMVSGKDNKTIYMPYEASNMLASLGGIKDIFNK